jgi:hypothetical protein
VKYAWVVCLLLSLVAGSSAGCGRQSIANHIEFEDLCPVRGRVTFQGDPIPDATVRLHPKGGAATHGGTHPPSGVTNDQGGFEIFTYRTEGKGRGAPAGEYEVSISWYGPLQGLTEDQKDELRELLPAKYTQPRTSGLRVTVQAGTIEPATFELE